MLIAFLVLLRYGNTRWKACTQSLSSPRVPFLPISDILTSCVDCFPCWFHHFPAAKRSASASFSSPRCSYFVPRPLSRSTIFPSCTCPPLSLFSQSRSSCIHSNIRDAFSLHASHTTSYVSKPHPIHALQSLAIPSPFTLSSPSSRYLTTFIRSCRATSRTCLSPLTRLRQWFAIFPPCFLTQILTIETPCSQISSRVLKSFALSVKFRTNSLYKRAI